MKIKAWSYKLLIVIGVIIILLILFNSLGIIKSISSLTNYILQFPLSVANKAGISISNIANQQPIDIEDIKNRNEELENIIEELTLENLKLKNNIESLNLLKEQIEFVEKNNLKYTSAKVIARPIDKTTNSIIINKGTKDGIQPGQAVIVNNGILIGKIYDASFTSSKVLLLLDRQSQITCQIQNKQNSPCLAKGEHGISIYIDLVPQTDEIKIDDYVITSGLDEKIPKGLLIGQIVKIIEDEGKLFKQAEIKTSINYNYFDIVSVVSD